ncbi:unnamed protein product [Adineta steineri]|uniref:Uncharacterized protein n=1 Tax=Adineta steineri TaxID=433720 RepID=A0A819J682_9BILA|nr:unnamed protein product [Adineta steineri]CAF3928103.1 unnamed protein product [Adineta steineri]
MLPVNDAQYISPNKGNQPGQSTDNVVTHEPPPTYTQFNSHPVPVISQNGQIPSLPCGYIVMAGAQQFIVNQVNVSDYLICSIFNSLCCLWPVGIIATVMSVITKKKKANCDLEGARKFSKLAIVFNILSTLGGIILITVLSIQYKGRMKFPF